MKTEVRLPMSVLAGKKRKQPDSDDDESMYNGDSTDTDESGHQLTRKYVKAGQSMSQSAIAV